MQSKTSRGFRAMLRSLPPDVQKAARKAFRIFQNNPQHRSLHFKKIEAYPGWYSVRIGSGYRAVGKSTGQDGIMWFFIGSHAQYDKLLD
jgi:mRNA-degrading endonuclease RelE of RelBE toxin-antitoxin system